MAKPKIEGKEGSVAHGGDPKKVEMTITAPCESWQGFCPSRSGMRHLPDYLSLKGERLREPDSLLNARITLCVISQAVLSLMQKSRQAPVQAA
jgi:hypothetical protein